MMKKRPDYIFKINFLLVIAVSIMTLGCRPEINYSVATKFNISDVGKNIECIKSEGYSIRLDRLGRDFHLVAPSGTYIATASNNEGVFYRLVYGGAPNKQKDKIRYGNRYPFGGLFIPNNPQKEISIYWHNGEQISETNYSRKVPNVTASNISFSECNFDSEKYSIQDSKSDVITDNDNDIERLESLKDLYSRGLITKEEYDKKRKEVLEGI